MIENATTTFNSPHDTQEVAPFPDFSKELVYPPSLTVDDKEPTGEAVRGAAPDGIEKFSVVSAVGEGDEGFSLPRC